MNRYYPEVAHRAAHPCEYCRAPEAIFNFPFEVEHVIPVSHKGIDEYANLALACRSCNIHKASHLAGFDQVTQAETGLFNLRLDRWDDHFRIDKETGAIVAGTGIGRATVSRLKMNRITQLVARLRWMQLGLFP